MPVAAALPFIGPIVGGVGSIAGGIKGSNAASSAGALQARAAQQAMQLIQNQLGQVNPAIGTAAQNAAAAAAGAAQTAGQGVTTAAQNASTGIQNAAQGANALLNPYLQTGNQATQTLAQMMAPGGQLMQPFTMQTMQAMDPGYQFRIDQANKALQASAAARGGALGGGTASALAAQTQNLASGEYANAFNRYLAQNQQLYAQLSGQAAQGQAAAGASGLNLMNAGQLAGGWGTGAANLAGNYLTQGTQYGGTITTNAAQQMAQNAMTATGQMSNLLTGGAAAQAAGQVGAANAWSNALGGLGNAAIGAGNIYNQQNLLNLIRGSNGNLNFTLPIPTAYMNSPYSTPGFVG